MEIERIDVNPTPPPEEPRQEPVQENISEPKAEEVPIQEDPNRQIDLFA